MVVDAWGKVLVDLKEEGEGDEGVIGVFEVDLEGVRGVRERMKLVRRTDVYPEV